MSEPRSTADPTARPPEDGGPAARAGMSVAEYHRRVWDMTRYLIHPTFLYVLLQVVGASVLLRHPLFSEPVAGWWREMALFGAAFLGAWAVFYSTLMRDAGLRSLTVTLLVPWTAAGLAAVLLLFPPVDRMSTGSLLAAALLLAGAGPPAWALTLRRWYAAKREQAELLAGADRG